MINSDLKEVNHLSAEKQKRLDKKEYIIGEPAGLLEFLLLKLTDKSRNNVKSLLTRKAVTVDGKTTTHYDYALKKGQTVRILTPDLMGQKQIRGLKILFEDDELIAVDKPAGLLSVSTDNEKEKTAYRLMTEYVRINNPKNRVFVVHRLDRDTSGVLIASKNENLKLALQENWNGLVKTRGYTAIVEGTPQEKSGTVRSWIKETKTHLVYSSGRSGDGLEAITHYEVVCESKDYSLLKITIDTGRKNQIRVHMNDLGFPVAGDKKYGAKTDPIKRLCLHADTIEFIHPLTGKLMEFKSALPKSFLPLIK